MKPFTRRHALAGLIAVALVQTAVLGWMIVDRNRILASPQQVVLDITPVDPRSLFQGDYVALGYAISQQSVPGAKSEALHYGVPVYVTLQKAPDGAWTATGAALDRPAPAEGQVVLRGLVDNSWNDGTQTTARLRYGIESYFVPEGTGTSIEDMVREHRLQALISVDSAGRAAIKGLILDGQLRVEEPLI